jgi:hypothetical protein
MGSAAAARSHKLINRAKDWVKQQPTARAWRENAGVLDRIEMHPIEGL